VFPGLVRKAMKLMPTVIQAVALVVFIHIVGQGLLSRYGGAKYRFSQTYQNSNFGANKVQKVIKYIDSKVPRYSPKPSVKKTTASTPSTTSTTPRPPPSIAVLEEEQKKRISNLRSTCSKYNIGIGHHEIPEGVETDPEVSEMQAFFKAQNIPDRPMWQNLYCSKNHQLSFCPIWKSASTFMLKKLLLISPGGKYDKESVKQLGGQANVIARKEFGYLDNWEMYPNFTTHGNTFIFVRHPFERILSAFRDKLEDPSVRGIKFNEYYYNKYGRRVVMYYRKEKITGPSFKYPRFNEFIDFLVDKDIRYADEHWAPFVRECTPCHVNYTFIGHFETLYWDVHLLANKTNLEKLWDDKNDYFQSSTYDAVSREYYASVDRDQIRKLYQKYKIDFELFGYSPEEYIKMGKPGPDDVPDPTEVKNDQNDDHDDDDEKKGDIDPDNVQLNVIKSDVKDNEVDTGLLEENEIKVKTILSDDER